MLMLSYAILEVMDWANPPMTKPRCDPLYFLKFPKSGLFFIGIQATFIYDGKIGPKVLSLWF